MVVRTWRHRAMTPRSRESLASTVRMECGLVRPHTGWVGWLSDRHVQAALAAAVPAWVVLGVAVPDRMLAPASAIAWVSLLLLQPIAEEAFFRGVLQGMLLRWTAHRSLGPLTQANVWTTAAFVATHLVAQPPGWALAVALPSLVFGHLRDRFASVLPATAVHVAYNVGFGLAAWWIHR
jgi:membrane protease YdiL (CAAX protease family)